MEKGEGSKMIKSGKRKRVDSRRRRMRIQKRRLIMGQRSSKPKRGNKKSKVIDCEHTSHGEESSQKSVLYMCITTFSGNHTLTSTDVHKGVFHRPVDFMDGIPPHMVENSEFSVGVLGSKLYFIGGFKLPKQVLDSVSVFDVRLRQWDTAPSMKEPRTRAVVLNYNNTIYAFGSAAASEDDDIVLSPDRFAEYYDLSAQKWTYLSLPPPKEMFAQIPHIRSHAFNKEKGVVFFWVICQGVYSYNFKDGIWARFQPPGPRDIWDPYRGRRWSNISILIDSFLIWHNFGTIYAYRFVDHAVLSLYTFPKASKKFGDFFECRRMPWHSYLVDVGNNKISLVYGLQHMYDSRCIRCHTFHLRYCRVESEDALDQLSLEYMGCKVLNISDNYEISSVSLMDSEAVPLLDSSSFAGA